MKTPGFLRSSGFLWFLAGRNVRRYWKRTLQSFLILFFSALAIMVVDSFLKGFALSASARIVGQSGHADLHARGYLASAEATPLDLVIAAPREAVAAAVAAAQARASAGTRVVAAASAVNACLVSDGEKSRGTLVWGMEPFARDAGGLAVPNPALAEAASRIVRGRFFSGPGDRGLLLDAQVAGKLGAGPGDRVLLVGTEASGSFALVEVPVLGVAAAGTLPGEAGALADLATVGEGFGLGGAATAVSLWFLDRSTGAVLGSGAEPAAARAAADAAEARGLEGRTFADLSAGSAALFEFLDLFLGGMMAVFLLVAGVGMANTILLSVQDRVKDLGTLRAIALDSRQAGRLIYCETFLVGTAAAGAALAAGSLLIAGLQSSGLALAFDLSEVGAGLPDALRPVFLPDRIAGTAAVCALFPLAAAVLPARVASRLSVRECFAGGQDS